jgi:hypothetical protein
LPLQATFIPNPTDVGRDFENSTQVCC